MAKNEAACRGVADKGIFRGLFAVLDGQMAVWPKGSLAVPSALSYDV